MPAWNLEASRGLDDGSAHRGRTGPEEPAKHILTFGGALMVTRGKKELLRRTSKQVTQAVISRPTSLRGFVPSLKTYLLSS